MNKRTTAALLAWAAIGAGIIGADAARAQPERANSPDSHAGRMEAGRRIYREGVLPSGRPLQAIGPGQIARNGADAACAACHRRSGHGGSEGQFVIRPVTGPALLQEQSAAVRSPRVKARLGSSVRPPYDEAALARAIRNGVDAAGKPLNSLMPRYALGDEEMKALTAYLFSLSAQPSPGVDERDIHFATVIQPGVAPERRGAMLEVMRAFIKDKDANTRSEEQRREAGNMRMYRAYRRWVLHVWELTGPSETWPEQLEAYYNKQPVFALIGGIGAGTWRPIHEFSERFEIPGIFPQVDVPSDTPADHYTFYLSRGVLLEAEVLARFLRDRGDQGRIVQVYRSKGPGLAAATAFRAALKPDATLALEDRVLEGTAGESFWRAVAGAKHDALVLWLGAGDVDGGPAAGDGEVYLSFSLLAAKRLDTIAGAAGNARVVYPAELPPKREARLLRNKHWLHSRGMALADEPVAINTLFAMAVVSDAVGHMADSFSRDYFIERVEHAASLTTMASVFQQVSLGPGQRFAAKGGSIVQVGADHKVSKALSSWIVP
jgi:hypothetical protein